MESILSNVADLAMLMLLQAVLGFDNLLYISIESKRAPVDKQALVRRLGIALAVVFRIALLFLLMTLIQQFQRSLFTIDIPRVMSGEFNIHSLIVLLGGVLIIYTATKEIFHMLSIDDLGHGPRKATSVGMVVFWIVAMNVVFSFDSILSAMALSDVFWVMASAIVMGGILMIWLADRVAGFLERNRMYEVLGLFILFVVGVMLLSEGGHLAHLHLFGHPVDAMSKTTFYFVISVVVLVDIVQGRYQKKLLLMRDHK